MTPYEQLRGNMDARVNTDLGDSIFITFADGTTATRLGFIVGSSNEGGVDGTDPVKRMWHLKIDRAQLPEGPTAVRRVEHPRLPYPMRMGPGTDADDGNAFFRDLQKAKP